MREIKNAKHWVLFIISIFIFFLTASVNADPTNLALYGTATQSSTLEGWLLSSDTVAPPSIAGLAIDNNTDGYWYHWSVTHTYADPQAWWQVDLLGIFDLDQIVIWNRVDGVVSTMARLSNFNVSVRTILNEIVWQDDFFTDVTNPTYPNPSLTIDLPDNILGQIVKVRLNGTECLSLAEVQVFGSTPSGVPEPTTLILLGLGLIGLAGVRKRMVCKLNV